MQKTDSFYNLETLGGILLFIAALVAMIVANSPFHTAYTQFLDYPIHLGLDPWAMKKSLLHWVNEGLMAVYFLLIGLEIKREMNRGVLSKKSEIIIPAVTAISGMIFPAALFILLNIYHPEFLQGWAIPTATDIAFTLGILALLGSRVPLSLKILLTAVAIFDDMGAIVIIAFFYTNDLSWFFLLFAGLITVFLAGLNYFGCRRTWIFLLLGALLWLVILKSGVHATIAGILLALTIPDDRKSSMLANLENRIHPWVIFFILPFFAFTNAGLRLFDFQLTALIHPIVLGTAAGLFLGKQMGIVLPLWYFVKKRDFLKNDAITVQHLYGIALICGVGFTMSLFIGNLAYPDIDAAWMPLVKIGVLIGSITSGLSGLFRVKQHSQKNHKEQTGIEQNKITPIFQ